MTPTEWTRCVTEWIAEACGKRTVTRRKHIVAHTGANVKSAVHSALVAMDITIKPSPLVTMLVSTYVMMCYSKGHLAGRVNVVLTDEESQEMLAHILKEYASITDYTASVLDADQLANAELASWDGAAPIDLSRSRLVLVTGLTDKLVTDYKILYALSRVLAKVDRYSQGVVLISDTAIDMCNTAVSVKGSATLDYTCLTEDVLDPYGIHEEQKGNT